MSTMWQALKDGLTMGLSVGLGLVIMFAFLIALAAIFPAQMAAPVVAAA